MSQPETRRDHGSCRKNARQPTPLLRVLTLNMAHGRRDGPNQMLLNKSTFQANLARISRLLLESDADIVGLQEVDGPSRWSGRIDHANTMAEQANYPWLYRADHATSWLFRYGTAVLSRLPFLATHSHRFAASPPTPRKGFVIGQVAMPGPTDDSDNLVVDVFSVHFDFLSRRARARQLADLIDSIEDRPNPVIVLGDFNSEWHTPESPVPALADRTNLTVYRPKASDLATHRDERLDWILISEEFEFVSYSVLPDVVSDHRPVLAEIGMKTANRCQQEETIEGGRTEFAAL